jgi:hypothetical protein
MERLQRYFLIIITVLILGYLYNYLMEISSLFTGNRKILTRMKIIEYKIDTLLKNKVEKLNNSKKNNSK